MQDAGKIGGFWEAISALIERAKGKAKKKKDATGSDLSQRELQPGKAFQPSDGVRFYIAVWV